VIGINTAIVSRTGTYAGIGFAIPVNMAEKVMNDIIEKGRVIRAWLGVYIRSLDQDLANSLGLESPEGALVASVVENSPADKAGLKVYDVIVSFNGEKVKDSAQLRNMVANSDPGTTARLEIIRDNRRKEVRAKLGELESEKELKPIAEKSSLGLGIEVENLNPDIARRLGYRIDEEGVVVIKVIRGSIADRKGVKTGDIIMEINRKRIYSVKDFYSAMRDLKSGDAMMMLIKRGKDQVIVGLKMP
ncbi:MAG: PDZ domain-containing protein, partial [Fidelibacterota bacterium]